MDPQHGTGSVIAGKCMVHVILRQRPVKDPRGNSSSNPRFFLPFYTNRFTMATNPEFSNPLRKFKLVFLGEQSGKYSLLT